ncbi:MAG: ferritin-like domain-containing protein, partial [Bacteroidales bacterium]
MQNTMNGLYHLASQAKNVHWNVTGPSFYGIHKVCDELDESARALGDRVAEHMRFMNHMPMIEHDASLTTVPQSTNPIFLVTA